jgi:hypothetical protein
MKTIKIIYIFFFFVAVPATVSAQSGKEICKKREQIQAEKLQFIEEKLQLTDEEKTLFLPVFKEFDTKRENLHQERHKIFRNYKKNGLNMSEAEILKTADQLVEIDIQTAALEKQYLEKYKKLLPPVKILLLFQSEYEFKKELLRKMKGGKGQHPNLDD